jgi:hypothetical protein
MNIRNRRVLVVEIDIPLIDDDTGEEQYIPEDAKEAFGKYKGCSCCTFLNGDVISAGWSVVGVVNPDQTSLPIGPGNSD